MDFISERLHYKLVTDSDSEDYIKWYTNEIVMKYVAGKALTSLEAIERFASILRINSQHPGIGFFAARLKGTNEFVGIAKLAYFGDQLEVGYGLMPSFFGNRYGTEILNWLVSYASSCGHKHLIAIIENENEVSKRMLVKKGFAFYKNELLHGRMKEFYQLAI